MEFTKEYHIKRIKTQLSNDAEQGSQRQYFLTEVEDPATEKVLLIEKVHEKKVSFPEIYGTGELMITTEPIKIKTPEYINELFSGSLMDCLECFYINYNSAFRIGEQVFAEKTWKVLGKRGANIEEYSKITGRGNLDVVNIKQASCETLSQAAKMPLVKGLAQWLLFERCEKAGGAIGSYFALTTFEGEWVIMTRALPNYKIEIKFKDSGKKMQVWPDQLADWGKRF